MKGPKQKATKWTPPADTSLMATSDIMRKLPKKGQDEQEDLTATSDFLAGGQVGKGSSAKEVPQSEDLKATADIMIPSNHSSKAIVDEQSDDLKATADIKLPHPKAGKKPWWSKPKAEPELPAFGGAPAKKEERVTKEQNLDETPFF